MELGYLGNNDWRDMSDYLVHFVGGSLPTTQARFDLLVDVVNSASLRPSLKRFGFTKGWNTVQRLHRAVCMSEVPLPYLHRLVDRHGSFGVGVAKRYARALGAQRVWYVDNGSELMNGLDALVQDLADEKSWDHEFWKVTRFIDRVVPEGDGRPRYEFEWEREWRVHGEVTLAQQVSFLFVPEAWQPAALDRLGPHIMIDPLWAEDKIGEALARG